MSNEIFISYSHVDSNIAVFIANELKFNKFDPWVDKDKLIPGEPWEEGCLTGVMRCQNFLFLISPSSVASKACSSELACALRHNKRLIPILVCPVASELVHPELRALHWIRMDDKNETIRSESIAKLIRCIQAPKGANWELADRPSANLLICYFDDQTLELALNRNLYWIGRRNAPEKIAGSIILPDPDPENPYVSRKHAELRAQEGHWYVFNCSNVNDILIYPPSKTGRLKHGTKIFIGLNFLIYKEVQPPKTQGDYPTFPGEL